MRPSVFCVVFGCIEFAGRLGSFRVYAVLGGFRV